jgi:hypothetical protein
MAIAKTLIDGSKVKKWLRKDEIINQLQAQIIE